MIYFYRLLASILILCLSFPGNGQVEVKDDFEGNGTITTWAGDNCFIDTAFANPFPQGMNSSATVLKYEDTGGQYANVRFDVPANFDLSEDHTFTLKVYVPSAGLSGNAPHQLSLKLQNGNLPQPWITQTEIIKPIVLDQWQSLSFDFGSDPFVNLDPNSPNPIDRKDFNRVLLQVNGENNNDPVTAYVDDLLYDGTVGGSTPSLFTELVWSDEFDQDGAVDSAKWHHQTLLPNGVSWFNGELQHYTDRLQNAFVEDGHLHIMARKETFTHQGQTKEYTSARLNSKFAFTYGKVEVRAKLPFGPGTWPAIWMLGKNISEPGGYWYDDFGAVPWPACGEIDIMEHWGSNQNYVSSALHTPCSFGGTVNVSGLFAADVSNTFHVYAVEWHEDRMDFSLDGNVFYTYQPAVQDACTWPFDADQYILLNVAMIPEVAPNFTESPMVIDYVRVYQEEAVTSTIEPQARPGFEIFPNPSSGAFSLQFDEVVPKCQVKVTDLAGRTVYEATHTNQAFLHLQLNLSPGIYFVEAGPAAATICRKLMVR